MMQQVGKNEYIYTDTECGIFHRFSVMGNCIYFSQAGVSWKYTNKRQHFGRKLLYQFVHPNGISEHWISLPKDFTSHLLNQNLA